MDHPTSQKAFSWIKQIITIYFQIPLEHLVVTVQTWPKISIMKTGVRTQTLSVCWSWPQVIATDKQEARSFHWTDTCVPSLTMQNIIWANVSMWVAKKCVFWKATTRGNYLSYKISKSLKWKQHIQSYKQAHADTYNTEALTTAA